MSVPALQLDIPSHQNNYMLPLDSPTSPHPNRTVDAVALIFTRVIQQNEQYLKSIHPNQPKYRCPKMISSFKLPDDEISRTVGQAEFTPETLGVLQARIRKFVHNYAYRTRMRNETLVGALVYLDRIVDASGIVVTRENWLLVTCMCLVGVQKMYDDFHYSLKDYSSVCGIPVPVLSRAEHSFLKLVRYDLVVSQQNYNKYRNYITQRYEDVVLREAYPCSPMSTMTTYGLSSIRDVCDTLTKTLCLTKPPVINTQVVEESAPSKSDRRDVAEHSTSDGITPEAAADGRADGQGDFVPSLNKTKVLVDETEDAPPPVQGVANEKLKLSSFELPTTNFK